MFRSRLLLSSRLLLTALVVVCGCSVERRASPVRRLEVEATAYSAPGQRTAFGERLTADARIIAVSRDLESEGLTAGTRVEIDGVDGVWTVGDRMAARWHRRIDLHLPTAAAARDWGHRTVRLSWRP